jgi:hypothetical protein
MLSQQGGQGQICWDKQPGCSVAVTLLSCCKHLLSDQTGLGDLVGRASLLELSLCCLTQHKRHNNRCDNGNSSGSKQQRQGRKCLSITQPTSAHNMLA